MGAKKNKGGTCLESWVGQGLSDLYGVNEKVSLTINKTRKEFEGDFTVVTFPLTRYSKKKPEDTAEDLGRYLKENIQEIIDFNVVKGFLNLSLSNSWWFDSFVNLHSKSYLQKRSYTGEKVMVEYCSPNTNKPIHLGHIRNILLGWSIAKILEHTGHEVIRTQIVNDRGIAICKSMLAWKLFSNGATPQSEKTKGDHFVGQYYVKFNLEIQKEYQNWQQSEDADSVFSSRKDQSLNREQFFKS